MYNIYKNENIFEICIDFQYAENQGRIEGNFSSLGFVIWPIDANFADSGVNLGGEGIMTTLPTVKFAPEQTH